MTISRYEGVYRPHFFLALVDDSASVAQDKSRLIGGVAGLNGWLKNLRAMDHKFRENRSAIESQTVVVSILSLNRGYLVQDAEIDDVPDFTESALVSHGRLGTPLWESWLTALRDLDSKIQGRRKKAKRARGYLFAVTDGEANPGTAQNVIADAKTLTANLLAPKNAGGGKATQLVSIHAVPIGPNARNFYDEVGVPTGNIFEPDLVSGEGCNVAIIEAMNRASLKSIVDSNPGLLTAEDVGGDDVLGDLLLSMPRPSVRST